MAKIITRGLRPEEIKYQLTCGYCRSVIEFDYKEGKIHSAHTQRDDAYIQFTCPICNHGITSELKSNY